MVIEPPHIILIPSSKSELSDSKANILHLLNHKTLCPPRCDLSDEYNI